MSSDNYFEYLAQISWKGKLYRRHVVYPAIKKFTSGRTLDVGCGIGLFLEYELERHIANDSCVQFAKIEVSGHTSWNTMCCHLMQVFDTIILDNVIEHIEKPKPLIKQLCTF